MKALSERMQGVLDQPGWVLIFCLLFILANLFMRDGFITLAKLRSDRHVLSMKLQTMEEQVADVEAKIRQAKDPIFVERQAKDKLDMANEDELVFVFSSE